MWTIHGTLNSYKDNRMLDVKDLPPVHHLLEGHNLNWEETQQSLHIDYIAKSEFTNPNQVVEGDRKSVV